MSAPARTGDVPTVALADALGERYLAYALSTIMSRSLPDVRDGLKPVHRRLLYAMSELRLDPAGGYKKCARVVGDVIGKFHPHGDTAVYEALARLAQDFSQRYPLIDGQGNFGNIDGDNPAAMRYTESRLTEIASALLDGIGEDTVDFRATYDGEEEEPLVLPARFPNLLANGATGIAVGMATNIPPHNVAELCDALKLLLRKPRSKIEDLVALVPGPDFPTGGVLVEPHEAIVEAYATGRGSMRLRARWEKETLKHGQYRIIVTEIPYQVPKARLIEKIAGLLAQKKLGLLADVLDESAETVRIVLEPKSRGVDADALMESLFRATDLETRFGLNMNVLDAENVPRVMTLREVLQAFLDHRHEVLERRTSYRLAAIARRIEMLEGYLVAYLNLDEVIRIVREEDDPRAELMDAFDLTQAQADAVLNMRLRSLRKLEEIEIRREHVGLADEQAALEALLANPRKRKRALADELADIAARFGADSELGGRRTEIGEPPPEIDVPQEALVEREPITILCSQKSWIRALRGHGDATDGKYKEGDRARFIVQAETTDKLVVFGTNGRFYTLGCDRFARGRGFGEPLRLLIELGNDQDIVAMFVHQPGRRLLVAATDGRGFVVEESEVIAQTRQGKQVLNLRDAAEAAVCTVVSDSADSVAVIGDNRKLLVFTLDEVPVMARGRGVILQRYKNGGLADAKTFAGAEGLTWRSGERTRTETDLTAWIGQRAHSGRLPPKGFPKSGRFT